MSGVQGKNGRNIRRLQVAESNVPSVGFKNVRALHEASAGDEVIDLTSLNAPSDAVANGYLAPTVSDLTKVNLKQFKDNVVVRTGTGQLIQDVDYIINGASTIRLSVPALDLQVFEIVITASPRIGTSLVDARPLVSTGTLTADTTDFNVGEPFEVGKFPSKQVGSIVVFVDGQQMYRNVGNQPDGEGDYYEVHAGAGLGTLIRFNTTDSEDRQVVVLSIAALADRPDGSIEALVQTLQGQVDNHREILEAVTGTTIAPGAPNDVDLKAFGDRVIDLETTTDSRLTALESPTINQVRVHTHNGYGATNTAIPRFSTVVQNLGSAITYEDTAADGASFTIEEDGFYTINHTHGSRGVTGIGYAGISLNSSQLTTGIANINVADRLAHDSHSDTSAHSVGALSKNASWSGWLSAGDIIRPHVVNYVPDDNAMSSFTIAKVR